MLSKSKVKTIRSLATRKGREQTKLFAAEGNKLVADLLGTFECELLVAEVGWIDAHQSSLANCKEVVEASHQEIEKASLLKNPQQVIALFKQRVAESIDKLPSKGLTLFLDHVQDPGNLGTIIRIADWFGIGLAVCSSGCADIYNPKTVQATMGSLARVKTASIDAAKFFNLPNPGKTKVFGTFMDGENIYCKELPGNAIIVMGNEGQGISKDTERFINERIAIPHFPRQGSCPDSLNVAAATSIICSEFRRETLKTN